MKPYTLRDTNPDDVAPTSRAIALRMARLSADLAVCTSVATLVYNELARVQKGHGYARDRLLARLDAENKTADARLAVARRAA